MIKYTNLLMLIILLLLIVFTAFFSPERCSIGLDTSSDVARTFGQKECFSFYENRFWTQTDYSHYVNWQFVSPSKNISKLLNI